MKTKFFHYCLLYYSFEKKYAITNIYQKLLINSKLRQFKPKSNVHLILLFYFDFSFINKQNSSVI